MKTPGLGEPRRVEKDVGALIASYVMPAGRAGYVERSRPELGGKSIAERLAEGDARAVYDIVQSDFNTVGS